MTCIKKGLSELASYRPRSSIMEVKSALPVPLFRLFWVSSFYVSSEITLNAQPTVGNLCWERSNLFDGAI